MPMPPMPPDPAPDSGINRVQLLLLNRVGVGDGSGRPLTVDYVNGRLKYAEARVRATSMELLLRRGLVHRGDPDGFGRVRFHLTDAGRLTLARAFHLTDEGERS